VQLILLQSQQFRRLVPTGKYIPEFRHLQALLLIRYFLRYRQD
jgi:hypothetical protein